MNMLRFRAQLAGSSKIERFANFLTTACKYYKNLQGLPSYEKRGSQTPNWSLRSPACQKNVVYFQVDPDNADVSAHMSTRYGTCAKFEGPYVHRAKKTGDRNFYRLL